MTSDTKFLLLGLAVATAVLVWPEAPCASLALLALLVTLAVELICQRKR